MIEILHLRNGAKSYTIKYHSEKFKCPGEFNVPLRVRYEHGKEVD
jgi:hypothetical protein